MGAWLSMRTSTSTDARRPSKLRRALPDGVLPYLLLAPSLLLLVGLIAYPVLVSLRLSFYDAWLGRPVTQFVGLRNYIAVLSDSTFWNGLRVTVVWTAGSVILQIVIGLCLAHLLNRPIRARAFFRAALFFPWVVPVVVVAYLWRWLYNSFYGVINRVLWDLGLMEDPILWLSSPDTALASAMVVNVWIGVPFATVVFLAALQTVPAEEYEAAKVDGATSLQEFWHVTLPNLKTIIAIVFLLRTIWITNNFSLMWLLTRGGPGDATRVLPIHVYLTTFGGHNFGQGSAIGTLMFLLLIGMSAVYFRIMRQQEG